MSADSVTKLAQEHLALREAISQIVLAWSNIENDFMLVLQGVLNDPTGAIASAIYFAPASAEVRMKIVDRALDAHIEGSQYYERISRAWQHTLHAANRVKKTRNTVSHGQLVTVGWNGKNHIRLTAPLFNFRPFAAAHSKRQLPGLSSNDIRKSASKMAEVGQAVVLFVKVADAIHEKSDTRLIEILTEIERRLNQQRNDSVG
jgi:hypothetical protein